MEQRYARITGLTAWTEAAAGAVVPIEFYHRYGGVGGGPADSPLIEVTVSAPSGAQLKIPVRAFEYASAAEAKAWRAEQKRLRARARRGLK